MAIKHRVEKLEKIVNVDEGSIYFVHVRDGVYTLRVDDGDDIAMSEKQFSEWENARSENDDVFVIRIYGG